MRFRHRELSYERDVVEHIPGITNIVADSLSRRTDPAQLKKWSLHHFLSNARHFAPQHGLLIGGDLCPSPGVATRQKFGAGTSLKRLIVILGCFDIVGSLVCLQQKLFWG